MAKKKRKRGPPRPSLKDRTALLVTMGPLGEGGMRRYTYAIPEESGQVTVAELIFHIPEGLYRLATSPSTRSEYRTWSRQLLATERATVSDALWRRKRWEVGRHLKASRVGKEVNSQLAVTLSEGFIAQPDHPAWDLQLPEPKRALHELPGPALAPFHHQTAFRIMAEQWEEWTGGAFLELSEEAAHERAIKLLGATEKWLLEWGLFSVRELLLDGACYFAARGQKGIAATFRDLVSRETADTDMTRLSKAVAEVLKRRLETL